MFHNLVKVASRLELTSFTMLLIDVPTNKVVVREGSSAKCAGKVSVRTAQDKTTKVLSWGRRGWLRRRLPHRTCLRWLIGCTELAGSLASAKSAETTKGTTTSAVIIQSWLGDDAFGVLVPITHWLWGIGHSSWRCYRLR